MQNRIRKLSAFFLVQLANFQKDSSQNFLIHLCVARRRQGGVLPLQPARGVDECAVFLRKARARQTIDSGLDSLHFVLRDSGRLPELAGLVRIDFADDQPIRFLQRFDVFVRVGTDGHAIHAEGEETLDAAAVHVVPDVRPGIIAVHFWQIVEGPVILFGGRVPIHGLHKADREFWRVRPIVPRIPNVGFRGLRSDALQVGLETGVGGYRDFQIAGKDFEDSGHVRGALNIGVAAQRVDATSRAPDVAKKQLQHCCGANGLCS